MDNSNLIIVILAFIVASVAIYALYSIILFQGGGNKGDELQLTTKKALEQIEVLFDKREYALVELFASQYLDRVPDNSDVRRFLAKAFYKDKKYNQAIKHCDIILKKNSSDIETHEILGNCYIQKGWQSKAIQEFEYIFEHKSDDKNIVKTLAELYRETEQIYMSIEAYNVLSDLMTRDEDVANIQLIIAELNEEVHNFPAAFEAYKRRLSIYPTNIETNKKIAELYIKIGNYPVALETLLYMLEFVEDPKVLLLVYDNIIDLYVETEDYEKAIEYSEKLLEVQGSDKFKIRDNIAHFNIKLGKVQDGILILEDLVLMSQNEYEITLKLAEAYIENKEYKKALERYLLLLDKATPREAKNINGLLCEMYIKWSEEKVEEKKFSEADNMLDSAAQYNPINPEVYYHYSKIKYSQKMYIGAVEQVNKALEYDKDHKYTAKYMILLADSHHNLGNFFEEKKALSDLLKYDEKNAEGLFRLGVMYATQNDIRNAEETLKKAITFDPTLLQAKYNLALIYENNNREKAKELYLEILEEDPTFEEAKRALSDLSTDTTY